MNNSLVEKIYAGKIDSLKEIHTGISNSSYLVNNKYVVRVKSNKEHFYSYKSEAEVLHKTAGLYISEIVVYLDKDGNKISEYIPNTHIFKKRDNEIIEAAKLLRKLHSSKAKIKNKFNPFVRYKYYKNESQGKSFEHEEKVIKEVKKLYDKYLLVICHNDCVDNNFLYDKKRSYLIDYEFAGLNIALFDLASFISENNIKDKNKINLFLKTYGLDKSKYHEVNTMIYFENLLWYYWALERYKATKKKVYKDIAEVKLKNINLDIKVNKK